jgi:hypothetical protein
MQNNTTATATNIHPNSSVCRSVVIIPIVIVIAPMIPTIAAARAVSIVMSI